GERMKAPASLHPREPAGCGSGLAECASPRLPARAAARGRSFIEGPRRRAQSVRRRQMARGGRAGPPRAWGAYGAMDRRKTPKPRIAPPGGDAIRGVSVERSVAQLRNQIAVFNSLAARNATFLLALILMA